MWAKYTYVAGATRQNILADLVAMVTGETNKANLSASCDKANTEILTSVEPAGWVVHDAAAGTDKVAIKAPCLGDANQFKYVVLDLSNTNGYLPLATFSNWNATTHVGSNQVTNSGTTGYSQRVDLTNGGIIYLSVSRGRLMVYAVSPLQDGCSTCPCLVMEGDRGYAWAKVGSGYAPTYWWQPNSNSGQVPLGLNHAGGVAGSPTSNLYAIGASIAGGATLPETGVYDAPGVFIAPVVPFVGGGSSTANIGFSGFQASGVKLIAGGMQKLDTITKDGVQYQAFRTYSTATGASFHWLVPKG